MRYALIIAGGKGTRFWPLSREKKAKQFLNILGKKSLLENTINRISPLIDHNKILVIGNKLQAGSLFKSVPNKFPKTNVILEPVGKNTHPCIVLGAFELVKKDPDAILVVLPSDHHIFGDNNFRKTIEKACKHVEKNNCLMCIGILPHYPHTGYGYIEIKDTNTKISPVKCFKEKPDKKTAAEFLLKGNFFWNAGIFVLPAQKIINLTKKYLPNNYRVLKAISELNKDKDYNKHFKSLFQKLDNISIDYGIMEKCAKEICMIRADFQWSDVGNWSSLETLWKNDKNKNAKKSKLITINSHDNIVYSEKRLITLVDINNLIIADSEDAILILPKGSDQQIKKLYEKLPSEYK